MVRDPPPEQAADRATSTEREQLKAVPMGAWESRGVDSEPATSVVVASETLDVRSLGGFQIRVGGEPLHAALRSAAVAVTTTDDGAYWVDAVLPLSEVGSYHEACSERRFKSQVDDWDRR